MRNIWYLIVGVALLDLVTAALGAAQALAPLIHTISDDTQAAIHASLTPHRRDIEAAMPQRERAGGG
jgi:hypothetical protein